MATPPYRGPSQPIAKPGGLRGRLSSYFGNEPPADTGHGPPSSRANRLLAIPTPTYAAASERPLEVPEAEIGPEDDGPMMCPIDPQALAEGQIAIVIPRQEP